MMWQNEWMSSRSRSLFFDFSCLSGCQRAIVGSALGRRGADRGSGQMSCGLGRVVLFPSFFPFFSSSFFSFFFLPSEYYVARLLVLFRSVELTSHIVAS